MSNFNCEICGAPCLDSIEGYIYGCRHHQPDAKGGSIRCESCHTYFGRSTASYDWILEGGLCWACEHRGEAS